MASGVNFTPLSGPSKKGPSGVRPGGFGNFGNTNFRGGPRPGYLTPQQIQYIRAGTQGNSGSVPAPAPAAAPPATPSPYDAQYFVNLAQATNNANNRIAGLQRNIDYGQTNLSNTLSQLEYNKGLSQTNTQNAENARGGFAQGALGQRLGQISHQYLTTENNDTLRYQQDRGNWEAAIAAIQQGVPLETVALGLASAQRQAALGLQAPPDAAAAAPSAPSPAQVRTWVTAGSRPPAPRSTMPERRSSSGGRRSRGSQSGVRAGAL